MSEVYPIGEEGEGGRGRGERVQANLGNASILLQPLPYPPSEARLYWRIIPRVISTRSDRIIIGLDCFIT